MERLKKLRKPKYIIRLAVAVLLLWLVGVPPKPIVVLGPQQHVETINPRMGVHTRLTDEVEEWKIKRTLPKSSMSTKVFSLK